MDNINIFDNNGSAAFFRVPQSGTLLQGGFTDYRSYFNKGIFFQTESSYYSGLSATKISGSDEIISTDRLSSAIDSHGVFWATVESNGISKLLSFKSGLNIEATIPFPRAQVVNDFVSSGVKCYFISGNSLMVTYESGSFSSFDVFAELPFSVSLVAVIPSEVNLLRDEFYALDQQGNGYKITSNVLDSSPDYAYLSLDSNLFIDSSSMYSLSKHYAEYVDGNFVGDFSFYDSFYSLTKSFDTF